MGSLASQFLEGGDVVLLKADVQKLASHRPVLLDKTATVWEISRRSIKSHFNVQEGNLRAKLDQLLIEHHPENLYDIIFNTQVETMKL